MTLGLIFIGPQRSGKTQLAQRIKNNNFNENSPSTTGVAFNPIKKSNDPSDISDIEIIAWDASGNEQHKKLLPTYIRPSKLIQIVIPATEKNIAETIQTYYNKAQKSKEGLSPKDVFIVISQSDLVEEEDKKQAVIQQAKTQAQALNIPTENVFLTSAKAGEGCNELKAKMFAYAQQHEEKNSTPDFFKHPIEIPKPQAKSFFNSPNALFGASLVAGGSGVALVAIPVAQAVSMAFLATGYGLIALSVLLLVCAIYQDCKQHRPEPSIQPIHS